MSPKHINIVGLGYVGQTLAVVLAEVGYKIYGTDSNQKIIENIKKGIPHVREPGLDSLIRKHLNKNFFVGTPEEMYKNHTDVFIICVTSPIDKKTKEPNIDIVKKAVSEIKNHLKKGQTIILRSTIPVGTTRNVVKPMLEESGLKAGKDFHLVFAPERTAEGVAIKELESLPQIIGGIDEESVDVAMKMFRKTTPTIICVSSLEVAEVIKLIDNSYRDVRFGFSNEIAKFCEKININAFEVITAANQGYERNSIPVPSPGVGGACLSKDPHILLKCARDVGQELKIVAAAREINEEAPKIIVDKLKNHTPLSNKKFFVVGFAFKGHPETNDVRDSPTLDLLNYLKEHDSQVIGYDPVVEDWKIKDLGVKHVSSLEEGLKEADVAIFMTNHKSFNNLNVNEVFSNMKKDGIVFDGWGLFKKNEIEDLGLIYKGVGVG